MSEESSEVPAVEDRRAFMTEREREMIAGIDTSDAKKYQTVSYLRQRLDELEKDVEWLAEHHPELCREVQDAVCDVDVSE
jgi:hypothetical protein